MNVEKYARLARRVALLEQKSGRVADDEGDELKDLEARVAEMEDSVEADEDEEFSIDDVELEASDDDLDDLEDLESLEDDAILDEEVVAEDISEEVVEDEDGEVEASLVDPDGVEEQITQDSLSEVLGVTKGTAQKTHDSMLSVGKKAYVAKMREASVRLDRVASYLEKTGRVELACRVDRIADAVDTKIAKVL